MMKESRLFFVALIVLLCAGSPAFSVEETKIHASDGGQYDQFGYSVSIDGDCAVVGAEANNTHGNSSGAAYFYHYNGGAWVQQQKISASDGCEECRFGHSVCINGDSAAVGAYYDDERGYWSGAVYAFHFNGSTWIQKQKFSAGDTSSYNLFGDSVAIEGNTILAGASWNVNGGDSTGAAYIFRYNGVNWLQKQKLTAGDGDDGDCFGESVSIAGEYAVIGAPNNGDSPSSSGSAYIFRYNGASWVQMQKIKASDAGDRDYFGRSVAIKGERIIVGAAGRNFNEASPGSAYIFQFNGINWVETKKITASDAVAGDSFGKSVSIDGDYAVAGADYHASEDDEVGSAYLFHYEADDWTELINLSPASGQANDRFGFSVSLCGNNAVVGACFDDDRGTDSGSAYIYDLSSLMSTPTPTPFVTPTPTPTQTPTPASHDGDVDGDGHVSPGDAYMAVQIYLGVPPPGADPIAADFCPRPDGDGLVDPGDAYGILKEYLGISPPC